MSDVLERLRGAEHAITRAEVRAARALERLGGVATSIERIAGEVQRQGEVLAAHLEADLEDRVATRERRRVRNRVLAAVSGGVTALAALAGALTR